MSMAVALLLACGLAMDAFAVAVASGTCVGRPTRAQAARMAACFGGFQMLMPVAGWLGGLTFRDRIGAFDHWLAFGLLAFVGGKMIWESLHEEDECRQDSDPFSGKTLLLLGVATSIDALAVGLGFSLLKASIVMPVLMIGAVTFVITLAGVLAGAAFGRLLGRKAEIAGGVVLIGIGINILIRG